MCFVDYRCEDCKKVTEYDKGTAMNDAPEHIICSHCGSEKTYRVFGFQAFDIAEGMYGNAKSGYSKGFTYHCNSLAPKAKGTKVR